MNQLELKRQLEYDPDTGKFAWKLHKNGVKRKAAGFKHHTGYIIITVNRKQYGAHRLAWLYVTGELPNEMIDHKNRVRHDNAFNNLRLADRYPNRQNANRNSNNTTGTPGVYFLKRTGKWQAKIGTQGKIQFLGTFDTVDKAVAARQAAQAKLHFNNIEVSP
jgi:hypothetical protein